MALLLRGAALPPRQPSVFNAKLMLAALAQGEGPENESVERRPHSGGCNTSVESQYEPLSATPLVETQYAAVHDDHSGARIVLPRRQRGSDFQTFALREAREVEEAAAEDDDERALLLQT